jgi:hypothetical protein
MKATLRRLAVLLSLGLAPSLASAQCCCSPIPQAPDACGRGFYYSTCMTNYGPMYYLRPPFPPYQGVVPGPAPKQPQSPLFPTHPFARGPRDFFMVD